jgi:hypothetical protein
MGRNLIAGLTYGMNYPNDKFSKDNPFLDLAGCHDLIIVDRKFFLEFEAFIHAWAMEGENNTK